jgi:hypothetical protein
MNNKKKYKATKTFDVNAFDNYEGLGNANHTKLCRGKVVEMTTVPQKLLDNKMIEEVGGKK